MVTEFTIGFTQAEIDDLQERLGRVRWPVEVAGVGSSRRIGADRLRELAEYWRTRYDWRAQEARLNRFAQFTTNIDGQLIHFLHVRSPRPDAKPLLMTHGYPSSVAEFWTLIDLLVEPDEGQAFHLAVPPVPRYAFSTPLAGSGWGMGRIGRAWVELMRRLGYDRYGVHGPGSRTWTTIERRIMAHIAVTRPRLQTA